MNERVHICAIAKNEGRYVREWCLFHQIVGVEHITIYDNASTDNMLEVLQPFIDSGFVDVMDWPRAKPSQFAAYQHYIDGHRGPWWTAFIDIDEFLFSPQLDTISEVLAAICQIISHSAIGVNWCCFGSGGQQNYFPFPVIERFTWRAFTTNSVNDHIKSVIWMDQPVRVGGDPHLFEVAGGTFSESNARITRPLSPHTSALLRLNHYVTKSDEELDVKMARGRADVVEFYVPGAFDGYNVREVDDREIQRFLPELKRRLSA